MPRDGTSGAKYIYVMRDGRDVVTSFYHHLRNQVGSGGFEGSFEDFFNGFMGGSIPYGRWVDHVKSWLLRSGPSKDSVLVVHYDDLLGHLESELVRINAFLGLEALSRDDLVKCADAVSFGTMKRNHERFQPVSVAWRPGFNFLRRGVSGDHSALLNAGQLKRYRVQLQDEFPSDILSFKRSYLE
mmetsp:Transcript_24005/g.54167  ORF Transcript_24005/g.54167 Transcript_24005/m.54167 type:complete len:185 (+) Transcript_24005:692-1246(+)